MSNIDMRKVKAAQLQERHDQVLRHFLNTLRRVAALLRSEDREDRSRALDTKMSLDTWCGGVSDGLNIPYGWFCKTPKRISNLKNLLKEVQGVGIFPPSPEALEALADRAEAMTERTGRDAS